MTSVVTFKCSKDINFSTCNLISFFDANKLLQSLIKFFIYRADQEPKVNKVSKLILFFIMIKIDLYKVPVLYQLIFILICCRKFDFKNFLGKF